MLSKLRDEVHVALGKQKGKKHRGFNMKSMQLVGVDMGPPTRRTKWGLIFEFLEDLPQLSSLPNACSASKIILDKAQAKSLPSGLTQQLSITQGPPGTGKSFIGTLLAKFICDFSDQIILVVCYTNHALVQFLEDLLDVGIPEHEMTRSHQFSRGDHTLIEQVKRDAATRARILETSFNQFLSSSVRNEDLWTHLEFEEPNFFQPENGDRGREVHPQGDRLPPAGSDWSHHMRRGCHTSVRQEEFCRGIQLSDHDTCRRDDAYPNREKICRIGPEACLGSKPLPVSDDGMRGVGKKAKEVDEYDLLKRWRAGQDAGAFSKEPSVRAAQAIWRLKKNERKALEGKWTQEIMMEQIDLVYDRAQRYDATQDEWAAKFRERDVALLRGKRIIRCTTTTAAKYASDIQEAGPQVVLVEEAGAEILLESHVITALGLSTGQLILIGDHKQLRSKVNNYNLTVEKGDGYALNYAFPRFLLLFVPSLILILWMLQRRRTDIQGLQDNIIFINHAHSEDNDAAIADKRDLESKSSKQNTFKAHMVLRIVRYLAQQ
ncbi:hypothetical protein BDZ89DRAFT_1131157 [Hymenopellis radicata]|nr:hypothetical protein BDZ89DRAFT_1131157 [Hymenopellis radicata]